MEKVIKFLTEKPGLRKESKTYLANRIGCTEDEVKLALKYLRNPSTPYEQFLEDNNIDERDVKAVWIKSKSNRSGMDFSILKSSQPDIKGLITEAFENIEPFKPIDVSYNNGKGIAIINIFDAHIDKISYMSETGEQNSYQKNVMVFMDAFSKILDQLKKLNPEQILFPIGSDFWQVNDNHLTTKKGTPQYDAVYTDTKEMFRLGIRLLRTCIDALVLIAPVHVIPVKGNHDEDRVFYLSEVIKMAYENEENVTVELNTTQRIYNRYHSWLFGFAHGDKEKRIMNDLPSIMSVERRHDWAEIKQGIFFLGDIHHEKQLSGWKSKDFRGVNVKFLRAVSSTDKWHYEHGWIGIPKTAYLFMYDKNGNEELEFKVNI
jgi:hypothetical protein